MTINSYFYDSVNGDRKYTSSDFAKAFGLILSDGIIADYTTGALGISVSGTNFTTVNTGKAVVQGHFIEVSAAETLTVPTGTYAGMIVLRVDMATTRKASVAVRTDQIPQKDTSIWELPLYNVSVTNGVIGSVTDLRTQGGAIAKTAPNVVTWTDDPNGVYLNIGTHGGKTYKLFLTSAQPAVGGTTERRAWIQMDA